MNEAFVSRTTHITHSVQADSTDAKGVERNMTLDKLDDGSYSLTMTTKWLDDLEALRTRVFFTPLGLEMLGELMKNVTRMEEFPLFTIETLEEI